MRGRGMGCKIRACGRPRYSAAIMPDASKPSPMALALAAARAAAARGEVPIGAVIVASTGEVVAEAGNRTEELGDPTAHAEMLVIPAAAARPGVPPPVRRDTHLSRAP